jgi:hypothetical protein
LLIKNRYDRTVSSAVVAFVDGGILMAECVEGSLLSRALPMERTQKS